jgi:branched-chain amino acid transport system substrate-binding protein
MTFSYLRRVALGVAVAILVHGASAAETGVSDREIRIGQSIDLSGPVSEFGQDVANGARAYFDLVNEKGGIHGRQIKLISLDDKYKVSDTVKNVQQLIKDDQVFALFSILGTPNAMAVLPLVDKSGVPLFAPLTGAQALRAPFNPNVFNIRASYKDEIEKIVQHLNTIGIKRVSVVFLADALGKDGLENVHAAMAKVKMKVHSVSSIETDASDAEKAAVTLHDTRPEAIILITAGKASVEFIKAYNRHRRGIQFYALSVMAGNTSVKALGQDGIGVVVSSVVPFPWSQSVPIAKEYQAAMKKIGLTDYSFAGFESYINAKVLAEAIQRTGKDLTRAKLIAATESMKQVSFGGFDVAFGKDVHQGSNRVELAIIGPNGRFIK